MIGQHVMRTLTAHLTCPCVIRRQWTPLDDFDRQRPRQNIGRMSIILLADLETDSLSFMCYHQVDAFFQIL
jgi:hypothetical protein